VTEVDILAKVREAAEHGELDAIIGFLSGMAPDLDIFIKSKSKILNSRITLPYLYLN